MDLTMGVGNVQNDTKGFIVWYLFLVGSVRNAMEKSDFKFL